MFGFTEFSVEEVREICSVSMPRLGEPAKAPSTRKPPCPEGQDGFETKNPADGLAHRIICG